MEIMELGWMTGWSLDVTCCFVDDDVTTLQLGSPSKSIVLSDSLPHHDIAILCI